MGGKVSPVLSKTNKALHLMNPKSRSLPIKLKKHIASIFIFPHIDYVCLAFLRIPVELLNKLESQLNKAIRLGFCFSGERLDPISSTPAPDYQIHDRSTFFEFHHCLESFQISYSCTKSVK